MSRLVKAVHATAGNRIPISTRPSTVWVEENFSPSTTSPAWQEAVEYTIKLELYSKAVVNSRSVDLALAIREAKRRLVEEVFGEFRLHFRTINTALWERDFEEARRRLEEMERVMFEEGE